MEGRKSSNGLGWAGFGDGEIVFTVKTIRSS